VLYDTPGTDTQTDTHLVRFCFLGYSGEEVAEEIGVFVSNLTHLVAETGVVTVADGCRKTWSLAELSNESRCEEGERSSMTLR